MLPRAMGPGARGGVSCGVGKERGGKGEPTVGRVVPGGGEEVLLCLVRHGGCCSVGDVQLLELKSDGEGKRSHNHHDGGVSVRTL